MTKTLNTKTHTDIKRLIWIESFLPQFIRPYAYLMRLDRPVGIWLLLLPSLWGITLASGGLLNMQAQSLTTIILFTIGAITMRGAGCIVNDLWDKDLDKLVERTKGRPIANGSINPKQAMYLTASLLLISLSILSQFNIMTIILGFITLPLIATYPLMKRITWWPQAFLGVTFNFGALMGYCATSGDITLPTVLLYFGAIFWTIGYDTIYAHQDKEDDAMAGIKSTARLFGNHSKLWVSGFYSVSILCISAAYIFEHGANITNILLLIPALHLAWQIWKWRADDQESALKIFKSNTIFGLIILAIFLI